MCPTVQQKTPSSYRARTAWSLLYLQHLMQSDGDGLRGYINPSTITHYFTNCLKRYSQETHRGRKQQAKGQ